MANLPNSSKGQQISETDFGVLIWTKDSKWVKSKNKGLYYIQHSLINMIKCLHFFIWPVLDARAEIENSFVRFLVQMKTSKAFKINRPLTWYATTEVMPIGNDVSLNNMETFHFRFWSRLPDMRDQPMSVELRHWVKILRVCPNILFLLNCKTTNKRCI